MNLCPERYPEAELGERLARHLAYGSDGLDQELAAHGIEIIAPNRSNRRKTQDGRPLRRYRRRWKVERRMAWLQNFRRMVTRWEVRVENYLGFLHWGCIRILLRQRAFVAESSSSSVPGT